MDPNELVLHVCYMLPYRLERNLKKRDEYEAIPCYHNPTFLYGTLDYLAQHKKHNFYWVGIISTEQKLTEAEETHAKEVLRAKRCFPVFCTMKEIQGYLMYYEN